MYYMETQGCRTEGHEDKPQHGQSGLCQACYRRKRRAEARGDQPRQKPGPKPDPEAPFSRYNPTSKKYDGGAICCSNGHDWVEGSYTTRGDGRKVCLRCIEDRKGDYCPAGLHLRSENQNKYGHCRACQAERMIVFRLKDKYGLTPETYRAKLEAQDFRCAICQEELDLASHNGVCVDHDHACCPGEKTCGRCVRDLLCGDCNQGLGRFKDNINILEATINYLELHA